MVHNADRDSGSFSLVLEIFQRNDVVQFIMSWIISFIVLILYQDFDVSQ